LLDVALVVVTHVRVVCEHLCNPLLQQRLEHERITALRRLDHGQRLRARSPAEQQRDFELRAYVDTQVDLIAEDYPGARLRHE
jgi:hypothetical protein